jgi:hypothetical protein
MKVFQGRIAMVARDYFGGSWSEYRVAYRRNVERALFFISGGAMVGQMVDPMEWYYLPLYVAGASLLYGWMFALCEIATTRRIIPSLRGIRDVFTKPAASPTPRAVEILSSRGSE